MAKRMLHKLQDDVWLNLDPTDNPHHDLVKGMILRYELPDGLKAIMNQAKILDDSMAGLSSMSMKLNQLHPSLCSYGEFLDNLKRYSDSLYGPWMGNLKIFDHVNNVSLIQDQVNKISHGPTYEKQLSDDLRIQIDKLENELVILRKQSNEKDRKINQLRSLIPSHLIHHLLG